MLGIAIQFHYLRYHSIYEKYLQNSPPGEKETVLPCGPVAYRISDTCICRLVYACRDTLADSGLDRRHNWVGTLSTIAIDLFASQLLGDVTQ